MEDFFLDTWMDAQLFLLCLNSHQPTPVQGQIHLRGRQQHIKGHFQLAVFSLGCNVLHTKLDGKTATTQNELE
jgi:hypothetical protein